MKHRGCQIDHFDKKAESVVLQQHEIDLKCCLKERLVQLLREEEIRCYQRSKTQQLLKQDGNTKYFQLIANGRHQKTHIFQLEDVTYIIKGDEQLKTYITQYYKGLFGPNACEDFTMDKFRRNDTPQVSAGNNEKLIAPFTDKEVRGNFQMKHNKSARTRWVTSGILPSILGNYQT